MAIVSDAVEQQVNAMASNILETFTISSENSDALQLIEGYHDDFKGEKEIDSVSSSTGDSENDLKINNKDKDDEGIKDTRDISCLEKALEQHRLLVEKNRKMAESIKQKTMAKASSSAKNLKERIKEFPNRLDDGTESKYKAALQHYPRLVAELERVKLNCETAVAEALSRLNEKQKETEEIKMQYENLQKEVIKSVISSNSDVSTDDEPEPTSPKVLKDYDDEEREIDLQLQKERMAGIELDNRITKLEIATAAQDKLAEGLFLIDYEQMKIENQSLNEKIEERNEEINRLKNKKDSTLQVLTHIKQKLHSVSEKNKMVESKLKEKESDLCVKRAEAQDIKLKKDDILESAQKLKEKSTTITDADLVSDIQGQKELRDNLVKKLEDLKERKMEAAKRILEMNKAIKAKKASVTISK